MAAPVFIGDEVTAAGYRLAGARVIVPPPGGAGDALRQARRQAPLVLITAEVAAEIGALEIENALAASGPLTVLVPDARGRVPVPDIAAALRRQLGMEDAPS